MADESWERVQEIFLDAADLSIAERARFLDHACGGDRELRRDVESLLRADTEGVALVEDAVKTEAACLLEEPSFVGAHLGPYRIVEEIGRGGMGAVFLAERDDDQFHKLVAVKVVKHGMDTQEVMARFRRERQILAGLEHPYIARLIDGGTTSDGRPFFVMERVEGRPIEVYCHGHGLDVESTLRLFLRVCEAVSHAHRALVVHRDLKPRNILVNSEGIPKLLDFGVAKLLRPDDDPGLTSTSSDAGPLTPEYASPEQVRGLPVTTATDVYALGAILFELLAGTRAQKFDTHTPQEIDRVVCETEPPRLSAAALAAGSSRRFNSDLDNIVAMAMRKERERRYPSVEQFAEDIVRYLKGHPVVARQDSFAYRAEKFVRRNRLPVAAAALVAGSLIAGAGVSVYQARRAEAARRVADTQRQAAEARLAQMVNLSNSSLADVSALLERLTGAMPARRELVRSTLDVLENMSKDADSNPQVRLALAKAYLRLGDVQGGPDRANIGDSQSAAKSYRTAASLLDGAAPNAAVGHEWLVVWLNAQQNLARVLVRGDDAAAMKILRHALAVLDETPRSELAAKDLARQRAGLYLALARSSYSDLRQARVYAEENLKSLTALVHDYPADAELQYDLSAAHVEVGWQIGHLRELESSARHYESAMVLRERLVKEHPEDALYRRSLMLVYEHVGTVEGGAIGPNLGKPEVARAYYERARPMEEASAADAQNSQAAGDYAYFLLKVASLDVPPEALTGSLQMLRRSVAMYEAQPPADRVRIASGRVMMGERLLAMGRSAESVAEYQRALAAADAIVAERADDWQARDESLEAERGLAIALAHTGDPAGALAHVKRLAARSAEATAQLEVGRRGDWSAESELTRAMVLREARECAAARGAAGQAIARAAPLTTGLVWDPNGKIVRDARALMASCTPGR